ncbi:MAG: alpha-galactosidase [Hyphomicrobiales bacterium]|nr:alpha-galactosidase [Hyphomicrobiales bacterium]MDE2114861.1 alpha-galactosidase [Hyphomicrobiales bacterium]
MPTWRVDAGAQSLVMVSHGGIPAVAYWGARLPEGEDLAQIAAACVADLTGGMLDASPELSLCPQSSEAFPGQPGLVMAEADGTPLHPRFRFASAEVTGQGLFLTSTAGALKLIHRISVEGDTGMIGLRSTLTSDRPIRVHWLAAPVLPAPQQASEMIDVAGRWIGEFQLVRTPWAAGIRMREARTGRSGHEHPPYLILPIDAASNTNGEAFGLQYGWSGGHRMIAEELPDGRRQVQFGHATGAETRPARSFETAVLYAAYSATGLNGIARANQRLILDRIVQFPDPTRPRPVHYNCWEAVYFDHKLADLAAIADRAAAIGAERFVLDDGWFGHRDNDTSSLGDWVVDRKKWPDGLHPLIAHVHKVGMTFGLWFEPEMVNPDSDLYRAHPEWALGAADQTLGRHQMVLDLSLAAVREYLFQQIDAILGEYPIDYIKWDHNRLLPVVDAAQTTGVYELLDRLRAAHPMVEIETCASGGGRIDAGILARTHRVWLSDSNDALERLRIQHDTALFLPASVTGSHVGPRHCHTSGRDLPMAFRAYVAAQRHMGFEMDLRALTAQEEKTLTAITAWWKAGRAWRMFADILRLDSADPSLTAEMQLARDGTRFTVFAGIAATSAQILPRPLRLAGLDPDARYRLTLHNREDIPTRSRGLPALKSGALMLSGQYLMHHGLTLPWGYPATMWVIDGERLHPNR